MLLSSDERSVFRRNGKYFSGHQLATVGDRQRSEPIAINHRKSWLWAILVLAIDLAKNRATTLVSQGAAPWPGSSRR